MNDDSDKCSQSSAEASQFSGFNSPSEEDSETNSLIQRSKMVPEMYTVGGGKKSYHGGTYQLRLLMCFLLRGISQSYSFSLATDMDDADKFDDIVFRYTETPNGSYVFRFLQAKHRTSTKSRVTLAALLEEKGKGDFSLLKYFRSFLKLKEKFKGDGQVIRDIIICSNANFKYGNVYGDFRLEENMFEHRKNYLGEETDEILQTKMLYFKNEFEGRRLWVDFLKGKNTGKDLEKDVDVFLNKLAFAMNQPNNEDLKKSMTELVKEKYSITDSENVFSLFQSEIYEWMSDIKGCYYTVENAKQFFEKMENKFGFFNFGFTRPVSNFVGRIEELNKLKNAHEEGNDIVVISGLGGIGKSELARKYIEMNSNRFHKTVWIKSDSDESVIGSIYRLAQERLGIKTYTSDGNKKRIETIMEEVYSFFEGSNCIFVFDNVEYLNQDTDDDIYIKKYFPTSFKKPYFLLTSRYESWNDLTVISLGTISVADSAKFLKLSTKFPCISDEEDLRNLAKELQHFPLALKQASAYINHQNEISKPFGGKFGIKDYLIVFEKEKKKVLNFKSKHLTDTYDLTAFTTWKITLDVMQKLASGKVALDIIKLISHFAPDDILRDDIGKYFEELKSEEIKNALILLKQYSMVSIENDRVSIHRLVQQVIRIYLRDEGKEEDVLKWVLKHSTEVEVEHSISLWKIIVTKDSFLLQSIALQQHIHNKLKSDLRIEEGYLFGKNCLSITKQLYATDDFALQKALHCFGDGAYNFGRYKEAVSALEESYHKHVLTIGENELDTWIIKYGLACAHEMLGRTQKASQLFKEVLENVRLIDKDNSIVSGSERKLAHISLLLGNYHDALSVFKSLYEKQKHSLGEEHLDTLISKHCIAQAYEMLGKKREALVVYEEVYEKKKHCYGDNHATTLLTRQGIGRVLQDLGEYRKSLSVFKDVYAREKCIRGVNHPETLKTVHCIGCSYSCLKKFKKAMLILEKAYEKKKLCLGEKHESTLNTLSEIGNINACMGKPEISLIIQKEVYEKQKQSLGENHPKTLGTQKTIAVTSLLLDLKSLKRT